MAQSLDSGHFGLVSSFFVAMTLGVFIFASSPRTTGEKVVVFVPPWSHASAAIEVIAKAGGAYVGTGNRPWIAIGISDRPHFVRQLYRAGALYVGSGTAFSACFPTGLLQVSRENSKSIRDLAKPLTSARSFNNKVVTS